MRKTAIDVLMFVLAVALSGGWGFWGYSSYQRWRQQEAMLAFLRAPLRAALAAPRAALFRNEHVTPDAKFLCGEVNVRDVQGGYGGFARYISYSGGYALEGESTASFYAPDEMSRYRLEELGVEIALLKQHRYTATREELDRVEFNDLWKATCI